MNSNGQFLLYDALLAFLILFLVLVGVVFVLNQEDDSSIDSNVALDRLSLLTSITIQDRALLTALSDNDFDARDVVLDVLANDSYVLEDLTSNRILLSKKSGDYDEVFCARKVVGGHEYELTLYV